MTQLREQLRQARRAYGAQRYVGDLAAELLATPEPRRPRLVRTAAVAALAAAAAVVFAVRTIPREPSVPVAVVAPPRPVDRALPAPVAYAFPDRMTLSLPAAPLVPATPPVSVSLNALYDLRQPYELLGPKLLQQLNWSSLMQPSAVPKAPPPGPRAATQQAV